MPAPLRLVRVNVVHVELEHPDTRSQRGQLSVGLRRGYQYSREKRAAHLVVGPSQPTVLR